MSLLSPQALGSAVVLKVSSLEIDPALNYTNTGCFLQLTLQATLKSFALQIKQHNGTDENETEEM